MIIIRTNPNEHRWLLKFKYRKSCNDIIIQQIHTEGDKKELVKEIYIDDREVKYLFEFVNRIRKGK